MTLLVTGGTGFVGSAIVRLLLAAGQHVRVLVRAQSNRHNIKDLDVEVVTGDLTTTQTLPQAVHGCTGVYHVAADYRLGALHPEVLYRTNVDGTTNLLTAAVDAGVTRIVYTSSVATLKANDGSVSNEDTPVTLKNMIGTYKRSKYRAEEEVRRLVREYKYPVVIVNPSTPVGPRDIKPTPTGRLILNAINGKIPAFVDTGLNIVHVDDVAQGHLRAFEHGQIGERYILGGENISLRDLLIRLSKLSGRRPPRLQIPYQLILPVAAVVDVWARIFRIDEPFITLEGVKMSSKKMYFSSLKAEKYLGYQHRPINMALQDALTWFQQQKKVL